MGVEFAYDDLAGEVFEYRNVHHVRLEGNGMLHERVEGDYSVPELENDGFVLESLEPYVALILRDSRYFSLMDEDSELLVCGMEAPLSQDEAHLGKRRSSNAVLEEEVNIFF